MLSALLLLFADPNTFLSSALQGASKGATLCLALLSSYALWLGLIAVWEQSGVTEKISALLKPIAKKLFKTKDEDALTAVCMNLSVNMLGMGGAATPYGIQASKLLDKTPQAEYASSMLFVMNATSVQLIPTAIIGVRASLGSTAPADIILPSLLTSGFSTALGMLLVWLFFYIKAHTRVFSPSFKLKNHGALQKTKGAGTR